MIEEEPDAVSAFAQLIEDMEKMAATMTRGLNKMAPPGWLCAVIADPSKAAFHLSISAPPVAGLPNTERAFPNIDTFALRDLPVTNVEEFKALMQATLDRACRKAEQSMATEVSRREITAAREPGDTYEATASAPRTTIGAALRSRYTSAQPTSVVQAGLERQAKQDLDSARAEEEALESIRRQVEASGE